MKCCKLYSGQEPEFVEGDVFRIIGPLDETYSFDYGSIKEENGINNLVNETVNAD